MLSWVWETQGYMRVAKASIHLKAAPQAGLERPGLNSNFRAIIILRTKNVISLNMDVPVMFCWLYTGLVEKALFRYCSRQTLQNFVTFQDSFYCKG